MKFIDRSNYKMHSIIALSIIWVGGIVILLYMLFYFDKQPGNKNFTSAYFSNAVKKTSHDSTYQIPDNSNTKSDAYVFININKKNFLTQFVSFNTAESNHPNKITPYSASSTVKKIKKIIKPKSQKKQTDFSIKAAPEI